MPDKTNADDDTEEVPGYDEWFREKVQASIDDPRPSVSHEEAERRFRAFRERVSRRRLKGGTD